MRPMHAVAVAATLLTVTALRAQQTRPTFRSGTFTASIYATVRAADGRLVPDLSAEDFEVREGIRRIVDATGGAYLQIERRTDIPVNGLMWLIGQLKKSYRLDFLPPLRDGRVHRLSVTLAGKAVRAPVRVRF